MKRRMATVLFVVIVFGGFVALGSVITQLPHGTGRSSSLDLFAARTGALTTTLDAFIAEQHPFYSPARTVTALVRFILFREGLGPVVLGRDSVLFTREEFEITREDAQTLQTRVAHIADVSRQLQARGQELVVVLVPSKSRVLSAYVPRRWRRLADTQRYTQVLRGLEEHGVVAVDALAAMRDHPDESELFLSFDTHWTVAGSSVVAEKTYQVLAARAPIDPDRREEFSLIPQDEVFHTGDLTVFLPLGPFSSLAGVTPERVTPVRAGETTPGDLFTLPDIPVVLIGTSFSAGQLWSFPELLKYHLQADLVNLAEEGRGPFAPMEEFLSEGPPEGVEPQIVVWEIPERYMTGQLP